MHEKKEVQYSACDYCTSFLSSYLVDTGLAGYRLYQPFFLKDPHQQLPVDCSQQGASRSILQRIKSPLISPAPSSAYCFNFSFASPEIFRAYSSNSPENAATKLCSDSKSA